MDEFEVNLNSILVDTFNNILKYEEMSLKNILKIPITVTEAHIIEAIGKLGSDVTVSELAALLSIAMPTATVAVKKLEKKGFVSKAPCSSDGRRAIISLTELGEKVNIAHTMFHSKMVANISCVFLDEEKDALLSTIKKLNEFFKEKIEV